ncbi:Wadjet anti-phage system protein JetD domain-containing protein [Gordonibacter sp. RACS_AR49]|uniref:Wadjet anti-phage system protein JetD domain-containing protein n=1 Tax=Gordonibacter sp. RACS_AR49 TaxID=2871986 RepID=UPI0026019116|nr:Wadjet anti-phage system protein JetD domain-containing protein [Gordonibacter sp. RACS_AR49]MDN4509356.1 DUF2220 domain-containing protein [Gordonibacter sp. RACS_AR49]
MSKVVPGRSLAPHCKEPFLEESFAVPLLDLLLDKYERSSHALSPGAGTRRVMINCMTEKNLIYRYEDTSAKEAYNEAALALAARGYAHYEWAKGQKGQVLQRIWLDLDRVEDAYAALGRKSLAEQLKDCKLRLEEVRRSCKTPWIIAFLDDRAAQLGKGKLTALCKKREASMEELLRALTVYDGLGGDGIAQRAFSIECFNDSKHFERSVRSDFLHVAQRYCAELMDADAEESMSRSDLLAFLGIYTNHEVYEFSGRVVMESTQGTCDFSLFGRGGAAFSSDALTNDLAIRLPGVRQVTLIENLANYDAYKNARRDPDEVVVYHGGFSSPRKRRFFRMMAEHAEPETQFRFWADIDLGGMRMFRLLATAIPRLQPMRMAASDVECYYKSGLSRSDVYFQQLEALMNQPEYAQFAETIEALLKHRVTIEQEVML